MLSTILRPVALPPDLIGQPAPCDLFDARGTLLLRQGASISLRAETPHRPCTVFCAAEQAERISPADPIGRLREIGMALGQLADAAVQGGVVAAEDFRDLARCTYEVWQLDADVCLGYVRLVQFDRASVCHAIHAALLVAELATANGLPDHMVVEVMGAALTMNLASMGLHDDMADYVGAPDVTTREALDAHPGDSVALLVELGDFPANWLAAVAQHHENIDGSGYPLGLRRGEITLAARMLRIADVLAARLSSRRGRTPRHWGLYQARDVTHLIEHVFGADLGQLDPTLVRLVMSRLGTFPPGSLVRLSNGELAVVSRRRAGQGPTPRDVLSFIGTHGRPLETPRLRQIGPRDVRIQGYAHDELPRLPPYEWPQMWGYRH